MGEAPRAVSRLSLPLLGPHCWGRKSCHIHAAACIKVKRNFIKAENAVARPEGVVGGKQRDAGGKGAENEGMGVIERWRRCGEGSSWL